MEGQRKIAAAINTLRCFSDKGCTNILLTTIASGWNGSLKNFLPSGCGADHPMRSVLLLATANYFWTIRLQFSHRVADVLYRYYPAEGTTVGRDGDGKLRDGLPSVLEQSRCFLRKQY